MTEIEDTRDLRVLKDLILIPFKKFGWIFPITLSIPAYLGLQEKLSILQLAILLVVSFFSTLGCLTTYLAVKEIAEKNEEITPSVSEIFEKEPEDVIIKNYEKLIVIKNLIGDSNFTLKKKLARLSQKEIDHWPFFIGTPTIQENINIKAYKIANGRAIREVPLKVDTHLKQKNLTIFQIFFGTAKAPEIEFMVEYSLNRVLTEMFTVGEWASTEFSHQVEKYKIEIKFPEGIQEIKRCCITKKGNGGEIIENGCYSTDDRGMLVPLQEACFPPSCQIESELNISTSGGRKIISLESNSGLNKGDSVRIWWLCGL